MELCKRIEKEIYEQSKKEEKKPDFSFSHVPSSENEADEFLPDDLEMKKKKNAIFGFGCSTLTFIIA